MDRIEMLFNVDNALEMNSGGDDDTCDMDTISSLFSATYHIESEISISLERTYVLHMDITRGETRKIVAGLSDSTINVYDCETLSKLECLRGHKKTISGVKCPSSDDKLIYTASVDGYIKLWDLRSPASASAEYCDDSLGDNRLKPLSCFDVNNDETFLVAGTELFEGDSFLLFWDVRMPKLLGGYWESHRDDITTVCFHPMKKDWLTSGSVDGLINVFDISEQDEDDAFVYCYNTLSSVSKLKWLSNESEYSVSCMTHTEDILLWKVDDTSPYCSYSREQLTKLMYRKCADYCYIVDIHETGKEGEQVVLCGSSSGRGECLRLLRAKNGILSPMASLIGNKQILRTSCYDFENEIFFTGGDSGLISMWKSGLDEQQVGESPLKVKSKALKNNVPSSKPY